MTKNKLIYGGIGVVILISGVFIFLSNTAKIPELPTQSSAPPVTSNNSNDLFANSSLPKATLDKLKTDNPELIQQLQNSYQNKPIQQTDSSITFVPVPQEPTQPYVSNKVQPIDYSKFNVVSIDPNETNRKLAQLQKEADKKSREIMLQQQQEYAQIYKESSRPDFGNNLKVPKEQILFFKDIKQKEFDNLMVTLNQILPTHPNKANLEKQVVQYKEYYAKLQNSINNNNVTYGMLLQHDEQHQKIVKQVQQIHNSFIGYTNNLYKNQFSKEETDAEFDKKNGITNQSQSIPQNPSAINYQTQVMPNPSAANINNNNPKVPPNPSAAPASSNTINPTGNAFR